MDKNEIKQYTDRYITTDRCINIATYEYILHSSFPLNKVQEYGGQTTNALMWLPFWNQTEGNGCETNWDEHRIAWVQPWKWFHMYMGVLPTCMSESHLHASWPWRPEGDIRTLELESQMAVSHYMGAGGLTWVLWKNSKCFQLRSHFSSLQLVCLFVCSVGWILII